MASHGLTPEELAMLTDEEREGLEAEEEEEHEEEELEEGQTKPKPEEAEEEEEPKPGTKPEGEEEPKPGTEQEQEEQQERQRTRVQMFRSDVPEDIETQRTALDTREDELVTKFDEGDITFAEYNKGIRELNGERSKLDRLELKAELAAEANQSRSQEDWANLCEDFVQANPIIGKNETLWNAFDVKLRQVTAATMDAGGTIGQRDLEKAFKLMQEDLGITAPPATDTPNPKKGKKTPVEVPPTLGRVPASQQTDTEDGKYAHLDRLAETDPEKYEAALMKMSDAERDAYMQAG
ncbi:hypothetical protein PEp14_0008 [Erwinia phage PEp14]|uniref:Uncharacterized protein n=1 Tax=Erwinia phage PEp14 TaxID=1131315 RepID=H2DE38_9CAUD|nr:hypothetical protein PEp14_0008 [Erwinia phage PEp14]AEY69597.1 hypothetical protein PEp14_0008 [Erwinia phage PEp14]